MKNLKLKRHLISALAAGAIVVLANAQEAPVKIGAVLSLSGPAAVFGIPERDAIQAVVANMNSTTKGGRKFEVSFYDDKSNPTDATRAVTQAINNDKVVAIMGPSTGSGVLAAGPIALRLSTPLIGPAGTLAITDPKNEFYPWIFRAAPSDASDVRAILQDMAKGNAKKIGIFYQEDAYGKTGVDLAREVGPGLGLEIVETASGPYTATDLTAQATKLRNAGAQAVFLQISIAALGSSFVKAARQVGLTVPIYANAGLAQRSFAENVGGEVEGLRILSIGNLPYDPSPGEAQLAKILEVAGKQPQGWGELTGVNALMAALGAIDKQKGKEIDGASMRETLESLCDFDKFSRGRVCYSAKDHDGWHEDSLVITEIRNKQFRTVQ
jgi:branched-chain amino acid transport system substrate-binding protein